MNEYIGLHAPHRLVNLHSAEFRIDAPALSANVAAPDEAYVAFCVRRSGETACDWFTKDFRVIERLKRDAIENLLTVGQLDEVDAGGKIGRLNRRRADDAPRVLKGFRRRIFNDHSRRLVAAAPDHRAIGRDVAALRAERGLRADFLGNDNRWGVGP